jgi:hypothetical protein
MYEKKSNSKCKAIIEITFTQTHQIYIYNFTFGNPFPMFINGVMLKAQLVPWPLFPFCIFNYYLPSFENIDIPRLLMCKCIITKDA